MRAWTSFWIPSSESLPPCDLPLQTEDCFVHDGLEHLLKKAPLVLSRQWFNKLALMLISSGVPVRVGDKAMPIEPASTLSNGGRQPQEKELQSPYTKDKHLTQVQAKIT